MTYAFTFDASACSGCKACQIACKDKNNLPAGVLWRRVYEVSGGTWQQHGDSWTTDVFAYNLSVACNHCVHPKCAGVCPTDAYVQREDGIVYIDVSKCMGCGYCSWACPYSAPRYNPELRHMTKCDFCYDNLDVGLPPACVAACPMRVLDIVEINEQVNHSDAQGGVPAAEESALNGYSGLSIFLWQSPGNEHPFPLPVRSRTEPHLAIQSHTGMENKLEKGISNWEEINTTEADKSETPLVAFTLLAQMAAGLGILSLFSGPLSLLLLITIGGLIGMSGLVAILHLGTPRNAWRAILHLKKSWLSREILMFGLFSGSWVISLALPGMGKLPLALCGIGLVYSMAQVYRLRSISAWDSNRTLLAFTFSALTLGGLGFAAIELLVNGNPKSGILLAGGIGLAGELLMLVSERNRDQQTAGRLRLGLIVLVLIGLLTISLVPVSVGRWIVIPIIMIALIEEVVGRWSFYEHLHQRAL